MTVSRTSRFAASLAGLVFAISACASSPNEAATTAVTADNTATAANDTATAANDTATAADSTAVAADGTASDALVAVGSDSSAGALDLPAVSTSEAGVFDPTTVHEIAIEIDDADYGAMLAEYRDTEEKEWIEATVSIDGTTYTSAGLRLKGNSSLRSLGGGPGGPRAGVENATDAVDTDEAPGATEEAGTDPEPEELPWLIRLDKFVDGQNHDGVYDFVVRSNNSETSLNEAVALDLLEAAGLATQDAMAVRFSVNGSEETLRLVIENPDDVWMADNFSAHGALYKAESTGDYSYRGEDPDSYDEVFDQEAGKDNTDLTPLIGFLEFINTSDDATFAAEIDRWLDVDSFATYLAMQDIVQNFDDIDGPGNNSYLYWDPETDRFTVVAWDHNLAFDDAGFGIDSQPGARSGAGGVGGARPGDVGAQDAAGVDGRPPRPGPRPDGAVPPADGAVPPADGAVPPADGAEAPGRGGGPDRYNLLSDRMLSNTEFNELYQTRRDELTSTLVENGVAQQVIDDWTGVLRAGAADLVPVETIDDESGRIATSLIA